MADRYFLPQSVTTQQLVWVEGDVAHHLINVMRRKAGDSVTFFDGRGHEYRGVVTAIEKRRLQVEIEAVHQIPPEAAVEVHVWSALPRGDRQRFLVEKLVEVGASSFRPLVTRHSVVRPNDRQQGKFEKWVIEATQQCGRSRLMTIEPALQFSSAVEQPVPGLRLMGDPAGQPLREILAAGLAESIPSQAEMSNERPSEGCPSFVVMVGPEGGWADEERILARRCGWLPASWGRTTMRIETAAIVATALLVQFGDGGGRGATGS